MRPSGHLVSSLIGAGLIHGVFGNFIAAILYFISSFFIDLDHVFDYVRQFGLKSLNIRNLLDSCYEGKFTKVSLIFHSFELLIILWIFITVFKLNILWISMVLGMSIHLIIDQFTNKNFALSYFFIYRLKKNFATEKIFYKYEDNC